ncbi:DUF4292 domain-containing protein [Seonamhaeicola maritimus]|uniref:DUF4292 domain-containing protein n=1 Tax=Seonamhaeicola maritimus TaxID=2591822 RepID=A0A5C7GHX9_9FLAO|nr:DUF4292 domain-containing protein [Seonamhaeicola maritimus]TXG37113.1 DUF4292 domain-containing protein [Seonamhaeicola maritimus]
MRILTQIIITLFVITLFNCKSAKTVSGGEANYSLSSRQLIKENNKKSPDYKTIKSTLKITYDDGKNTQSHSVNFRAKKDETLWMSATFSVVKALVTPDKVSFYNKLDNTYFEGDYAYLSGLLGTDLDFQKVQSLLIGDAIYDLKEDNYKLSVDDESYILQPKKQREPIEIFFLLDPSLFKLKSQQISQPQELRHLQIDYLSHQEVDKQILPEKVKVIAVEANEELIIGLEFKNVTLNEDLRFPFKIPSGYKEIKL